MRKYILIGTLLLGLFAWNEAKAHDVILMWYTLGGIILLWLYSLFVSIRQR